MHARLALPPLLASASSLLLGACSIVNDAGDHQQLEPVPVEELCADFSVLACDAYLGCCDAATVTPEDCRSRWASGCADLVGELATDPRTGYDARAAAEVLAELQAFGETCSLEVLVWRDSRSGLQRVLSGTVPGGGDCTPSNALDRAAYFSCDDLDQACFPQAGVDTYTCADRSEIGGSCSLYVPYACAEGLRCDGATVLTPGLCAARLEDGQPCGSNQSCVSLYCDTETTGLCVTPTAEAVYCSRLEPPA